MTWRWVFPWRRYEQAREAVNQDAAIAKAEKIAAEFRQLDATDQAAHSRTVTARLRYEIDKNGWTELLQHAWGGR